MCIPWEGLLVASDLAGYARCNQEQRAPGHPLSLCGKGKLELTECTAVPDRGRRNSRRLPYHKGQKGRFGRHRSWNQQALPMKFAEIRVC